MSDIGPGATDLYTGPPLILETYSYRRRENEKPYLAVEVLVGDRKVGMLYVSPEGKRVRWYERTGRRKKARDDV